MNIHFQQCIEKDLEKLKEISIETFYDTFHAQNKEENMARYLKQSFTIEKLREELQNEHSTFYFLMVDEQIAGYLKVNIEDAQTEAQGNDALEVERIYLKKSFQGKGLGELGLQKAIKDARKLGKRKIWLGVWEKNVPAIRFYKKHGFIQTDAHTFWMGDEQQIDYIMMKVLDADT